MADFCSAVDSAACGLCANACPVGIETGVLMKQARGERRSPAERRVGRIFADHFRATLAGVRMGLRLGRLAAWGFGGKRLEALSRMARRLSGGRTPIAPAALPRPVDDKPDETGVSPDWLYLPSCASRTFGPAADDPDQVPLPTVVRQIASRAGMTLGNPSCGAELCCGMPWESKGLNDTADRMADAVLDAVEASGSSRALLDTSPCAFRLRRRAAATGRTIMLVDLAEFLHDELLPKLDPRPMNEEVMLHITCSSRRMGLEAKLAAVARACARTVIIPERVGCCGFAGDKGFALPELNDHALRDLPAAVPQGCGQGYSTSRTCEIGLASHAGIPYSSLAYLVEKATRFEK